ncbi:uncharacterized protein ARMOST_08279 [Armillaria ostoyae]|uniref:Acetyl-CoA hydrolase/transferase C-terminal domain-containing protein n=1 Tax=Armillaria ostoyae TaxID=47428 RepID=A0A284R857_ARMOS|nr:uncharacterized protein ARMOST_08279 [Armillaria ostoyae]
MRAAAPPEIRSRSRCLGRWIIRVRRPDASVGAPPEFCSLWRQSNTLIPNLEGLHDINQSFIPPHPAGRLPEALQSGIGNVAKSGLADGPFDRAQLDFVTATSIRFSLEGPDHSYAHWAEYKDHLLLRSQHVINSPELIRRPGVIAMNTPWKLTSMLMLTPQTSWDLGGNHAFAGRPTKTAPTGISCIVPFASHVDQTKHDLDIVVTEQGLTDPCGLSRAPLTIEKCAHPDYKGLFHEYYDRSLHECTKRGASHEPHILGNAFKFHINFMEHGTMKDLDALLNNINPARLPFMLIIPRCDV